VVFGKGTDKQVVLQEVDARVFQRLRPSVDLGGRVLERLRAPLRGQHLDVSLLDDPSPAPDREPLGLERHDGPAFGEGLFFPVEEPVHQNPGARELLKLLLDIVTIRRHGCRDRAIPHPLGKHELGQ
jgi:hypothetical protein